MNRQPERVDTAARILDIAERLVQVHGFNGVSYADVAAQLQITTAALHYHFPGKAELGEALISRYGQRFGEALVAIEADTEDARARLDAYADLYRGVLRDERMCLCGMLAAEFETLPTSMQKAVVQFFEDNEAWLVRVLTEGREQGTIVFAGSPVGVAQLIVSGLEGAMLIARPFGGVARFEAAARRLLDGLQPVSVERGRRAGRLKSS
jgi:TetR/AcrR family transcriptional regulator, transcriptional repressor for nem operon